MTFYCCKLSGSILLVLCLMLVALSFSLAFFMEDLPMEEVKYLCFPKKLKFELLVKIIFIKC